MTGPTLQVGSQDFKADIQYSIADLWQITLKLRQHMHVKIDKQRSPFDALERPGQQHGPSSLKVRPTN